MADAQSIDLVRARAFLSARESERQAELDQRFMRAARDFDRILSLLKADARIVRIWQWGSLLDRRKFTDISDIDIAIEGLAAPEAYFEILGRVMNVSELPLDLVELEKVGEENARSIRERGRLVYERSP